LEEKSEEEEEARKLTKREKGHTYTHRKIDTQTKSQ